MQNRRLTAVVCLALASLLAWGCPESGGKDDAGLEDGLDGAGDLDEPIEDGDGSGGDNGEASADGDGPDDGDDPTDGGDSPSDGADGGGDSIQEFPRLGVYTVDTDGSNLELLLDAGTRAVTHVRALPGSTWMTGTRYAKDPDGNGLAMEVEAGHGAHYNQTEIIVFDSLAPDAATVVAGGEDGKACANSSWTQANELVYLHQDHPADPNLTRLKRASFSQMPTVDAIAPIPLPAGLFLPVDPHQVGPSDATGSLVFSALVQLPEGWARPVWKAPASGTADIQAVERVGCPMCQAQAGCCTWPELADVLGTNDPRLNHAGTAVSWMQQHPEVTAQVGPLTINPWRQVLRVFGQDPLDLPTAGVEPATSLAFGAWSPDDSRLVYWAIEIDQVVKHRLYTMAPDGTDRQPVPLPAELCATHPHFIGPDRLVFSAWRCGTACSCSPEHL